MWPSLPDWRLRGSAQVPSVRSSDTRIFWTAFQPSAMPDGSKYDTDVVPNRSQRIRQKWQSHFIVICGIQLCDASTEHLQESPFELYHMSQCYKSYCHLQSVLLHEHSWVYLYSVKILSMRMYQSKSKFSSAVYFVKIIFPSSSAKFLHFF